MEFTRSCLYKMKDMKKTGKKNRAAGARFELKVRKDLEDKGWVVSKWMNNLKYIPQKVVQDIPHVVTVEDFELIPAKHKFRGPGIPMAIGTGFPDFIAFKTEKTNVYGDPTPRLLSRIVGVESKMNGYLDKTEKEKCKWLLDNKIFSKILIASKGEKRGEIKYTEV